MGSYKYAKTSCKVFAGGRAVSMRSGEIWHASSYIVAERPDLFDDEPSHVRGEPPKETPAVASKRRDKSDQ